MDERPSPWTMPAILAVAALVRAHHLGRASFWYDEVATIRLARTAGPSDLLRLLGSIDATRAPLHPLLLQAWVGVFGPSEGSARAFSLGCGVLTVAIVYRIGRRLFDARTGLWAAWLAALSPMLILYSREARMYAWLVLLTCLAWDALISIRESPSAWRPALYALAMPALGYSHPLGLLMMATLGLAALGFRRSLGLSWGRFFLCHCTAALAVAPWVGRYLDHDPEWTVGRLPIRFLLGTPIGFLGGNFLTLAGFAALILLGLLRMVGPRRVAVESPISAGLLLAWLLVPPLALYAYSRVGHPIFGPARYTVFVAPAYLILVARGLARLPKPAAIVAGLGTIALSLALLPGLVFAPDLKADWRSAAAALDRIDPSAREPVVIVSPEQGYQATIVEAARYYLGPARPIATLAPGHGPPSSRTWYAVSIREGRRIGILPDFPGDAHPLEFDGLQLIPAGPAP